MKHLLHQLRHWIGWAPCTFDVFDHPTLSGFKIGVLTCAICGRQSVLFEIVDPVRWMIQQIK